MEEQRPYALPSRGASGVVFAHAAVFAGHAHGSRRPFLEAMSNPLLQWVHSAMWAELDVKIP
jgi:hypothetical protein